MTSNTVYGIVSEAYIKKINKIFTRLIFITCIIAVFCYHIYIQESEKQNILILEDTLFLEEVNVFEGVFLKFLEISEEMDIDGEVTLFADLDKLEIQDSIELLQEKLKTNAKNELYQKIETVIYNAENDIAVSKDGQITIERILTNLDISLRDLKLSMDYLKYKAVKEYCFLTDTKIIVMTQKSNNFKNSYIISYTELTEYEGLAFWGNTQNVLDLRNERSLNTTANHNFFYIANDQTNEIVYQETDNIQYRLYKSKFFDIIYCGINQKYTTKVILQTIVATSVILLPTYAILYCIVDRFTRIAFVPSKTMMKYIINKAGQMNFEEALKDENFGISVFIRKIEEKDQLLMEEVIESKKVVEEMILEELKHEEEKTEPQALEIECKIKSQFEEFIVKHISEDISLGDVATYFGFSPTYTSTLFKSKMKMNFKDYVSYQRYLYSLEIIKSNPKIKISDLAEQVGVANANTFIRIFKKYNSMTPKQYMGIIEQNRESQEI